MWPRGELLWRDISVMLSTSVLFRAWRQKIEAWLQENEKEEKQSEELRRRSRRVQSNRRSLEADSGTCTGPMYENVWL
jgi:hypothetical protein